MLVKDHIKFLRERVAEQTKWLADHGGDLEGYIRHYGDPDRAPLDANGNCKTLSVPAELAEDLRPVPDAAGVYYAPMFGCGGTAIYRADKANLEHWEAELAHWESRHYGAIDDAVDRSYRAALLNLLHATEDIKRHSDSELAKAIDEGWKVLENGGLKGGGA